MNAHFSGSHARRLGRRDVCLLGLVACAGHAWAAPGGLPTNVGHGDSSPQWERLRSRLFGTRPIAVGAESAIELSAPLRAAYGASVPVKITARQINAPQRYIRRIVLLVDQNPSAVAATLTIDPSMPRADFETRLRVDEYSHVRAIAEWNSGELSMDSRFVKTSGGCSAPPNRDRPDLLGQTRIRLPAAAGSGPIATGEVVTLHPNDTGFELNNVTVMFIPPHFVRTVRVTLNDRLLFESDQDFSISENPQWRFTFTPPSTGGVLRAVVQDSKDSIYEGQLELSA